jgi:hypothetical protein
MVNYNRLSAFEQRIAPRFTNLPVSSRMVRASGRQGGGSTSFLIRLGLPVLTLMYIVWIGRRRVHREERPAESNLPAAMSLVVDARNKVSLGTPVAIISSPVNQATAPSVPADEKAKVPSTVDSQEVDRPQLAKHPDSIANIAADMFILSMEESKGFDLGVNRPYLPKHPGSVANAAAQMFIEGRKVSEGFNLTQCPIGMSWVGASERCACGLCYMDRSDDPSSNVIKLPHLQAAVGPQPLKHSVSGDERRL